MGMKEWKTNITADLIGKDKLLQMYEDASCNFYALIHLDGHFVLLSEYFDKMGNGQWKAEKEWKDKTPLSTVISFLEKKKGLKEIV